MKLNITSNLQTAIFHNGKVFTIIVLNKNEEAIAFIQTNICKMAFEIMEYIAKEDKVEKYMFLSNQSCVDLYNNRLTSELDLGVGILIGTIINCRVLIHPAQFPFNADNCPSFMYFCANAASVEITPIGGIATAVECLTS